MTVLVLFLDKAMLGDTHKAAIIRSQVILWFLNFKTCVRVQRQPALLVVKPF